MLRKLLEDLPNKVRDLLGIVVPPYPNPISYRGHYYMRSGSTLQELNPPRWFVFAGGCRFCAALLIPV